MYTIIVYIDELTPMIVDEQFETTEAADHEADRIRQTLCEVFGVPYERVTIEIGS